jgi:signal transduction histidine kinase
MSSASTRLLQTDSFRLAAIYAGLFLVSTLLLMALVFVAVSRAFEADLLRASSDDLVSIQRAYVGGMPRGKALHEANEMIEDRQLATDSSDVFLLVSKGRKVAGNLPFMAARAGELRFPYPAALGGSAMAGHTILGRGVFLARGDYAFAGRDLQIARDAEQEVIDAFAVVLAVSLLIAAGGGMLMSRSFLRRIDAITATCRDIMSGRLGERIPVRGSRNELDRLAGTINEMLNRIATLMDSLRQVSNDIAHDLRTPLAHLRYRLERAQANATTAGEYARAVDEAIADCDHLLAMFAALLRIAQIESGARRAGMAGLDLSELLRHLAGFYEPVVSDAGHPFAVRIASDLEVVGDSQLLFRLFANLIDNAVRHTPPGAPVTLEAYPRNDAVVVAVSDRGAGIPAEDHEKVFRRFFRREQSRTTPGSGLGLSLVSAIAELHSTRVVLADNCPGLRASVELRSSAPDEGRKARSAPSLSIRKDTSPKDHQSYSET